METNRGMQMTDSNLGTSSRRIARSALASAAHKNTPKDISDDVGRCCALLCRGAPLRGTVIITSYSAFRHRIWVARIFPV